MSSSFRRQCKGKITAKVHPSKTVQGSPQLKLHAAPCSWYTWWDSCIWPQHISRGPKGLDISDAREQNPSVVAIVSSEPRRLNRRTVCYCAAALCEQSPGFPSLVGCHKLQIAKLVHRPKLKFSLRQLVQLEHALTCGGDRYQTGLAATNHLFCIRSTSGFVQHAESTSTHPGSAPTLVHASANHDQPICRYRSYRFWATPAHLVFSSPLIHMRLAPASIRQSSAPKTPSFPCVPTLSVRLMTVSLIQSDETSTVQMTGLAFPLCSLTILQSSRTKTCVSKAELALYH